MTPEEEIARLKSENLSLKLPLAAVQAQLVRASNSVPENRGQPAQPLAARPVVSRLPGNPTPKPGPGPEPFASGTTERVASDYGNIRHAGEAPPQKALPALTGPAQPLATGESMGPVQSAAFRSPGEGEPWVPVTEAQVARPDVGPQAGTAQGGDEAQAKGGPSWRIKPAWLGVLAFVVGSAGEALLFQESLRGIGAVVQVVAVVLAILAWGGMRERPILLPRPDNIGRLIAWRAGLALRLGGIIGALGLWAASLWAYLAQPDEIFGLQGWLWLAAMLLFIVSCLRWQPRSKSDTAAREDLGPAWTRNEMLILAGIVALSFFMRIPWLRELPWDIKEDVFLNWRETLAFMDYPPRISLFTTTYIGLGQPSLWFAIPALSMKVFGSGLVGMRMPIAIFGALLVLPVYGIARLSWGKTAAGVAAFTVAVSASMIHWSGATIPDMATCLWWTSAFYFLLRGLRSRRPADFMWAGLISGTSQYTHYASRILPLVLAVFFIYLAIFHFRPFLKRAGHLALVAAGFLIGAGPINGYFVLRPEQWGSRATSGLLIPLEIPTTWDALVHIWNVVSVQLWQNFLMFSVVPSRDRFYYASMLLPWEGVLLVLGVGWLVWKWKQPAAFLMLLWGGSLLALNSIVEVEPNPNPNLTHFRPAWSAFYLALALPPALWLASLRNLGHSWWRFGAAVLGVGAVWLLASNTLFYLFKYPEMVVTQYSFRTVQDRVFLNSEPSDVVRVVGYAYRYEGLSAAMLAPHTPAGQWFNQSRELPLVGGTSHDQVFLYLPTDPNEAIIRHYYPQGQVVSLPISNGQEGARAYRVSASQVQAQYGVKATFTQAGEQGAPLWEGHAPSVGMIPPDAKLTYPVTATWSGAFYAHTAGEAQAQLSGGANAQVWLPGQTSPNGPTFIDSGWLPFVARAELAGPAQMEFLLQLNGGEAQPVDSLRLWPQSPNAGLAVSLGGEGAPHRIDPFVGSTLMWPVPNDRDIHQPGSLDPGEAFDMFNGPGLLGPQPVERGAIRWEGELYVDGGQYGMNVYTGEDWQAQLTVDGQPLFGQCLAAGGNHGGQVNLSEGWHHVQLDVAGGTSNLGAHWLWSRPDGVTEVVPPWRLRYTPAAGHGTSFSWPSSPGPINCQP